MIYEKSIANVCITFRADSQVHQTRIVSLWEDLGYDPLDNVSDEDSLPRGSALVPCRGRCDMESDERMGEWANRTLCNVVWYKSSEF